MFPIASASRLVLLASVAFCVAACCKKGDESETAPVDSVAPVATASGSAQPAAPPEASETPAASGFAPAETTAPPKASAPPSTNTAGASAVKACCSALSAESKKAKGPDKGPYDSAFAVCNSLVKSVQSGAVSADAAKLTIRAQLQRAKSIPPACR